VAMYMSISASALGIAEHQGIKISMYLRILIPIIFSRYVVHCDADSIDTYKGRIWQSLCVCYLPFLCLFFSCCYHYGLLSPE